MPLAPLQKVWIVGIHPQWLEKRVGMCHREPAQCRHIDEKLLSLALPSHVLMQHLQGIMQDVEKNREITQIAAIIQRFPFRKTNKGRVGDEKIKDTFDHHLQPLFTPAVSTLSLPSHQPPQLLTQIPPNTSLH